MQQLKTYFITFCLLLSTQAVLSQSTSITFSVNMNEQIARDQFNAETEFVDIAGSFNSWGSPNGLGLQDEDADGIYHASTTLSIGNTIEFKGRINGEWNGREEFAGGGPNRSYTVSANDTISFWYNDEVSSNVLLADFSASSVFAVAGEVIQFTDLSSGSPISWQWTFEGGTPNSSTQQHPLITFTEEGQHTVSLEVTNADGEAESKTIENYITIGTTDTYWWNESVFYEIFVRSFYDANGDGKGDFNGLIEKLDYLNDGNPATHNDLGITGIWLMPMQESPSYHGYDVTDYRKVEPDYGTNEDFKRFMAEAHQRGIKVIIDYVMNHSSSEHPWFSASKNRSSDKRDWYVWKDNNPGGNGPWGQQVWHQNNGDYYYGIFWGGMPDLNYATPAVKAEMFDISSFWLSEMQVDGFRLDAVKYIYEDEQGIEDTDATFQFWKDFRTHYKSVNSEAFAVGEAWTSTDKASKYVVGNGLDYVFEFDLANAILGAVQSGSANQLNSQLSQVLSSYPYLQFGTFLTNHDIDRVMDVLGNDEGQAKLAANLLLSLPGIPYLYYGEEIGMNGSKPDEDIRLPMQWNDNASAGFTNGNPWRAPKADFSTKNVAEQQLDTASLWSTYHEMIALRNTQPALQKGDFMTLNSSKEGLFAGLRHYEDDHIIICINLRASEISQAQLSSSLSAIAAGSYTLLDLKSGLSIPLTVAANGAFTIEIAEPLAPQQTYLFKVLNTDATLTTAELRADMSSLIANNTFDPATETVELVSNRNAFGDNLVELADADADGIYSATLNNLPIGQQLIYKYRINGLNDDRAEFNTSDYMRTYRIKEGENIILDQYAVAGSVLASKNELSQTLSFYPNPAQQAIKISRKQGVQTAISYQIHGINGQRYQTGQLSPDKNLIELAKLPDGLYLLFLETEGIKAIHKLVVSNN